MTQAERFTITIMFLGLLFTVLLAMLGLLIRVVRRWTQTEERLAMLTDNVSKLAESSDRRLTWLEQNLWNRNNRR